MPSPCNDSKWDQSLGEELANSISHGIGLLAGLVGAPMLMFAAWRDGDRFFFVGTVVFTAAVLLVYLGSTLYHAWPRGTIKSVFQV
ncbi:MAG: hemolysin III family protein, partial [Chthoniobacterales bacterium]